MVKTSTAGSFEGFSWKKFILGFKKPAIILLASGVSILATYPELAGLIAMFGGAGVVVERIWAIIEFYIKEVKL